MLLVSVYLTLQSREPDPAPVGSGSLGERLRLSGEYPTPEGTVRYVPRRIPLGFGIMAGAGTLSGLLGIGSGAVKVLALDQAMRLPFKVSTTTSNFMIGVTAAASAGIYLHRGFIAAGPDHAGDARRAGGVAGRSAPARDLTAAVAAFDLRRGHSGAGHRDDRHGTAPVSDSTDKRHGDEAIEAVMSRILRVGVLTAAALVAVGGVVYLVKTIGQQPHYSSFTAQVSALRSPLGIVRDAIQGKAAGLIELGLIVLVLTPVARVAFALLAFARQRDLLYVAFSVVVLSILVLSLTGHGL